MDGPDGPAWVGLTGGSERLHRARCCCCCCCCGLVKTLIMSEIIPPPPSGSFHPFTAWPLLIVPAPADDLGGFRQIVDGTVGPKSGISDRMKPSFLKLSCVWTRAGAFPPPPHLTAVRARGICGLAGSAARPPRWNRKSELGERSL